MVGVYLGGGSREFIARWFYRLQRNVRDPSDRQHGVAATDSFAVTDVHTRCRHSGVSYLIVHNAPAPSIRAFGSSDGVCEDRELIILV
jgi:hypothetical protein